MTHTHDITSDRDKINLTSAVAMGTGVMTGAGIFALTGQIAGLAKPRFPLSFIAGAIVTAFGADLHRHVEPVAVFLRGLLFPVFGNLISPKFTALAMSASSISVVLKSLRPRRAKI